MIIWRIRHLKTGLFWNDVRWAILHGTFKELDKTPINAHTELVKLKICPLP